MKHYVVKLTTFVAAYQHVLFMCFRSFQVFHESVRVLLARPDDVSTRFAMETRKVNKFGRSHHPGVTLDQDFRCSIIDRIISDRGDPIYGLHSVCSFRAVSICASSHVWNLYSCFVEKFQFPWIFWILSFFPRLQASFRFG